MNHVRWHLSVQQFLLAKEGSLPSECEDAIGARCDASRFCVADGATEAFDSKRWAKLLTRCWAASNRLLTPVELELWLLPLGQHLQKRWTRRPLPWYAEEKSREGAFAAFVGINFMRSGDHLSWQAIALGDSCLIQMRANSVVEALPISDPEGFGYHPTLIPSNMQRQQGIGDRFTVANGRAQQDDIFMLLTDAIAAWYLRMVSEDQSRVSEIDQLLAAGNTDRVEQMIVQERHNKSLRNDDVAIVRIGVGAPESDAITA